MIKINPNDILDKMIFHIMSLFIGILIVGLSIATGWATIFLASIMISFHNFLVTLIIFVIFVTCYFVGKNLLIKFHGETENDYWN